MRQADSVCIGLPGLLALVIGLGGAAYWIFLAGCGVVMLALLCFAGWALSGVQRNQARACWHVLSAVGCVVGVALILIAFNPGMWNNARFFQHQLIQDMTPYRTRPLAVLAPQSPRGFAYYLHRPVHVAENVGALCDWARAQPADSGPLVLYNPDKGTQIAAVFGQSEPLLQSPGSRQTSVIVAAPGAHPRCTAGSAASSR